MRKFVLLTLILAFATSIFLSRQNTVRAVVLPTVTATSTPGPRCLDPITFTQMTPVPTSGRYQQGVAAGDFDEDGNEDIVFSVASTNVVSIRFGDGTGEFFGNTDVLDTDGPWGIVTEDFNQDQHLDFAVMSSNSGIVRVWLGNGDGTFNAQSGYNSASQWPTSFDAVDLNLDGKMDLLSVNFSTNNITIGYGDGNGSFSPSISIPVGSNPGSAVAADLDNDGIIDLASANYGANSLSIRLGTSGGTFTPLPDVPVSNIPLMVRAGDFNGDGNVDLVVNHPVASTMSILLGDGTGAFTLLNEITTPTHPYYATLSDLNNDGQLDIVVVPNDSVNLGLFIGDGFGGFTSVPGVFIDYNSSKVAIGDFNNDGKPDLATGNASGFWDRIIINLGTCTLADAVASSTSILPSVSPNAAGWFNTDVSFALTAEDNAGGAGVQSITYSASGAQTIPPTTVTGSAVNVTISGEGETTFSYFAEDNAGNVESPQTLVVKIDKTAPTFSVISPANQTYLLNQAVTVDFSCSDSVSGVANCDGSSANGSSLDTSGVGTMSFTVNATDIAGNSASSTVNYTVGYGVEALFDQTKVHKSGSTVPIKIRLVDANGANVSTPALLPHAISVIQVSIQASTEFGDAGNSNPDFDFRYDADLGGYIFNLQTTGFGTGTYVLNFTAGSPQPVYSVGFQIRQ